VDLPSQTPALRFEIAPQLGESLRACSNIARAAVPPTRMNLAVYGLYAVVGLAAYVLTPSRLTTFVVGMLGVVGSLYAIQFASRSRQRRFQGQDPHSRETHFVELTPEGIHTWCAHIDARYSWSDFAKATENKEFYLFVRPSGAGTAIPKRLINETTETMLRQRISEWSPDHGAHLARV
jgi:hypothetical protein